MCGQEWCISPYFCKSYCVDNYCPHSKIYKGKKRQGIHLVIVTNTNAQFCKLFNSNVKLTDEWDRWSVRLSLRYAKIRSVFLCWWEKFSLLSHLINLRLVLSYSQNSHGLWKQFSLFHAVTLSLFLISNYSISHPPKLLGILLVN